MGNGRVFFLAADNDSLRSRTFVGIQYGKIDAFGQLGYGYGFGRQGVCMSVHQTSLHIVEHNAFKCVSVLIGQVQIVVGRIGA